MTESSGSQSNARREFFREILHRVRQIMAEQYKLNNVSIRPVGGGGSRLSVPVKIKGVNEKGVETRYFGKIVGNSEMITERTIQLFKNLYLASSDREPMFGAVQSPEEMTKYQFRVLQSIYDLGIPTAKPLGYHSIDGTQFLLVAEFLDAKPISSVKEVSPEILETVFGYLRKMHSKGIYHGDIKPENIMLGDRIYIIDIGNLSETASPDLKQAYDLACQLASFVGCCKLETIVSSARKFYSGAELKAAAEFMDLVQKRPDIDLPEDRKRYLIDLIEGKKQ
jgi:tRNA A-37 threonylcarbamoyl transferase component Bud32